MSEYLKRLETTTVRKTTLRIVPFVLLLYLVCYLDRVNISFASLEMNADLGLSAAAYGFGASIFFVGYIIFEVPSNVMLQRVGARIWLARIIFTWGILAGCMALVQGPVSFYILRFLLGVAEAGFFPGIILYLTYWFTARRRAQITAAFMAAIPLSGLIGAPLSTWLMTVTHGLFGLRGWQAMFIIEAIPAVLLGIITFFYLSDRPEKATWLKNDERRWLSEQLALEAPAAGDTGHVSILRAITKPVVLVLGLIYVGLEFGEYALGFFLPQMVQSFEESFGIELSVIQVGLIAAIPSFFGVLAMVLWGRHSDRKQERNWHIAIPAVVGAIAITASPYVGGPVLTVIAFAITAAGIYSALPIFWQLPPLYLSGTALAAGIAMANAMGNISGIIGPTVTGLLKTITGTYAAGTAGIGLFLLLAAFGAILLGRKRTGSVPGQCLAPQASASPHIVGTSDVES